MARELTRDALLRDEVGAIRKAPDGKLRVALLYPHSYAVAMSNLGFQTIYRLLNAHPDIVCERAFLPARGESGLRTLESGWALGEMDVVAFSVSFELDYPHLPRMLRMAGIEPFARARQGQGPLVLAGGATVCYNPEPIAPFFDAAVIGEADEVMPALATALIAATATGSMEALAALPGVYVPAQGAHPVTRLIVRDLDAAPTYTQVFTPHTEFGEMGLLQIGRGCPYGCSFCVASHVFRPVRWRSLEALQQSLDLLFLHRRRIGLIGASVTDHPAILPLCEEILRRGGEPAPASMRADALTVELLALLAQGKVRTVTLAPETGLEPLRRRVGKRLSDDSLFAAVERVARAGIPNLKLYFIVGLPDETDEDVAAIPALVLRLAAASGLRVSVGCSAFVPKPGTPFARQSMATEREIRRKFEILRRGLHGRAEFTTDSPRWAYWQAVLARSGREIAPALALIAAGEDTSRAWHEAFENCHLDPDAYALRAIPGDSPVPWGHIGVSECGSL